MLKFYTFKRRHTIQTKFVKLCNIWFLLNSQKSYILKGATDAAHMFHSFSPSSKPKCIIYDTLHYPCTTTVVFDYNDPTQFFEIKKFQPRLILTKTMKLIERINTTLSTKYGKSNHLMSIPYSHLNPL